MLTRVLCSPARRRRRREASSDVVAAVVGAAPVGSRQTIAVDTGTE